MVRWEPQAAAPDEEPQAEIPAFRPGTRPAAHEVEGANWDPGSPGMDMSWRPEEIKEPPPEAPKGQWWAAWLPDPRHRHEFRYWDGNFWTDHVSDGGLAGLDPL